MILAVFIVAVIVIAVLLPVLLKRKGQDGKVEAEKKARLNDLCRAFLLLNMRHEQADYAQIKKFNNFGDVYAALQMQSGAIDYVLLLCSDNKENRYYKLQYVLSQNLSPNSKKMQQVRINENRKPPVVGEVVSLEWSGDSSLSYVLASDELLNNLIVKLKNEEKGLKLWVNPSMIGGYAAINTSYSLPTVDSFDAIERIAAVVRLHCKDISIDDSITQENHDENFSFADIKEAIVIGAESLVSENLNKTAIEMEHADNMAGGATGLLPHITVSQKTNQRRPKNPK
ncbi:MAG: hypothetical protein FWF37_03305 [Chloroflexi bacterium]|nr:hypothetical protein [Chloroflexota bacterium]